MQNLLIQIPPDKHMLEEEGPATTVQTRDWRVQGPSFRDAVSEGFHFHDEDYCLPCQGTQHVGHPSLEIPKEL